MECPYCEEPIFDLTDATLVGASYLHTEPCAQRFDEEFQDAFERFDGWPLSEIPTDLLREQYLEEEADRMISDGYREAA